MKYQKEIKSCHTKEQFDELNKLVNSIVLNDFESNHLVSFRSGALGY